MNQSEAAKMLGCTRQNVSHLIKTGRLPKVLTTQALDGYLQNRSASQWEPGIISPNPNGRPAHIECPFSEAEMRRMYNDEGMSIIDLQRQAGQILGRPIYQPTIQQWMSKYGIKPRSRIEAIRAKRGGKREGAGRKELPPEIKKSRLEVYVETSVYDWVKVNGGNKFAAEILTETFRKGLIV